jgi:hypothetical protein
VSSFPERFVSERLDQTIGAILERDVASPRANAAPVPPLAVIYKMLIIKSLSYSLNPVLGRVAV